MFCSPLTPKALAVPLSLAFALGLGAAACGDGGESDCVVGSFGCSCFPGNVCLAGLTCLGGFCLQFSSDETGDPGDGDPGDGDPGDGDPGDGDPGDGDPGDGDPGDGDPGDGDGDGEPGDGDGDRPNPCDSGPIVVLYSQGTPSDNDTGILVGTFTDFNSSSVEIADDFVIPQMDGCWCLTQVIARGFYDDGNLPSEKPNFFVEIYNDGGSVPTGAPIVSDQGELAGDDIGEHTAFFSMEVIVPAGTHWLSFRPELENADATWYWRLSPDVIGDQAAARDQDEILFGGLCTIWTPASACYEGDPPNDYEFTVQFDIIGVRGGAACN
jgi:hypothetical protein